jgi:His/Glu/Gln/Arg/opine family amino acid ABC transporter permease subunit
MEGMELTDLYIESFITVLKVLSSVAVISISLGSILAVTLAYKNQFLRALVRAYLVYSRGTPVLIHVMLVYFGLPQFGINLDPITAGIVGLGINHSGYCAEIIRSGMKAVAFEQIEAAYDLGCKPLFTILQISLPQAFLISIPTLTNELISILLNTSILSAITVMEFTHVTQLAVSSTFKPFTFYFVLSIIYISMSSLFQYASSYLEIKVGVPGKSSRRNIDVP